MSSTDPNTPRRGGSVGWIIGILVLIGIGVGIYFWGGWNNAPDTAAPLAGTAPASDQPVESIPPSNGSTTPPVNVPAQGPTNTSP